MNKSTKIGVIGDLNIDIILNELQEIPKIGYDVFAMNYNIDLGGSAGIFTHALSYLGYNTILYSSIGKDLFADYLTYRIENAKIKFQNLNANIQDHTGISISFSKEGDRGFISIPIPIANWSLLKKQISLFECKHIHISSSPYLTGLTDAFNDIYRKIRKKGITISADPQGFPECSNPLEYLEKLNYLDLLFLNQEEAERFLQKEEKKEKKELVSLLRFCNLIVVKCGSKGAKIIGKELEISAPAYNCKLIETTGAGDSFNAAFLYAWLQEKSLDFALRFANYCGARTVEHLGGTNSHKEFFNIYNENRGDFVKNG